MSILRRAYDLWRELEVRSARALLRVGGLTSARTTGSCDGRAPQRRGVRDQARRPPSPDQVRARYRRFISDPAKLLSSIAAQATSIPTDATRHICASLPRPAPRCGSTSRSGGGASDDEVRVDSR